MEVKSTTVQDGSSQDKREVTDIAIIGGHTTLYPDGILIGVANAVPAYAAWIGPDRRVSIAHQDATWWSCRLVAVHLDGKAQLPRRSTAGAAGYDLCATDPVVIPAWTRALIGTGVSMEIPEGVCGQIWPRSGLSCKNGIETGAGLIDSDYRGEIKVVLHNLSDVDFQAPAGSRIAQIVLIPIITPALTCVEAHAVAAADARGSLGFGSTGL
jgi:dUTP pyrophosphatase